MVKKRFLVAGLLVVLIAVGVVAYYFLYPYTRSGKAAMITDKYIFSVVDKEYFEGEGFFATLKKGGELFIYGIPGGQLGDVPRIHREGVPAAKRRMSPAGGKE